MAWFKFGKQEAVNLHDDAPAESVEALRNRAKYRLIGSVVLVGAGIVGFPMLFDSQPRTVAVDIPIEIPDKTKTKPLTAAPPSAPAPGAVVEDKVSLSGKEEIVAPAKTPGKEVKTPAPKENSAQAATKNIVTGAAVAAGAVAVGAAVKANADKGATDKADKAAAEKAVADKAAAEKAKAAVADKAKAAEAEKSKTATEASRAKALLEGQAAQPKAATAAAPAATAAGTDNPPGTRYIVQFGSYAESAKAQDARLKVEKSGLKTYSQVAKTPEGQRIRVRVGPFTSQAEADKAAAKIKALDLPAAILTL